MVGKFEKTFEKNPELFEVCDVCCCCKHVVRIPADLERAFDKPALWKLILDQNPALSALRGHSDSASAFWQEYRLRQGHYEAPNQPDRLQQSSFITVSALSPTLAIASSISALDEPKCLHHCRTRSLVERSTRCLSGFEEVEINAIVYLVLLAACPKSSA